MLQEIFLSLSGHRSPLWDQVKEDPDSDATKSIRNYLAPSEMALLAPLAYLSDTHIKLRDHTEEVSTSHPSAICRAVASKILSDNLGDFRKKILEVERSILLKDAAYVGAYGIVPLSTVLSEFSPWTRRLDWLWQVATHMSPSASSERRGAKCTGAELVDHLEKEAYTGYSDLEEMATRLLEVAQRNWMRQVATWILYGKLPSHDGEDFCIGETGSRKAAGGKAYKLRHSLIPKCVAQTAAASLLSIGESLNQIRSQTTASTRANLDPVMALLPVSLAHLNEINYPLSSAAFTSTINSIRLSISQNALSQLLPLPKVLEVLDVIQEFQLLGRGEFAIALINHANARVTKRPQEVKPVRKAGRLDEMTVKEAETSAVLSQTFADLASLQREDEDEDEILEKARSVLRLVVKGSKDAADAGTFVSTLLPTPTILDLVLPKDSALNLFLSPSDINIYATINSYLISLRRAELHLSSLWKITSLRRCQRTPLGPPSSARPAGQKLLATQRAREAKRSSQLRRHWANASKVMFVLNELGVYIQGEVIHGSWEHFRRWIGQEDARRPQSAGSAKTGSRPGTASSASVRLITSQLSSSIRPAAAPASSRMDARNDPVALAQAHRIYLRNLFDSLLLGQKDFIEALQKVLTIVDHFVALFSRIQSAWQGLDLQDDEGVVDALSDFGKEEREVLDEMARSGGLLEEGVHGLVEAIGKTEHERNKEDVTELEDGIDSLGLDSIYVPRRARTIDRLIMKLDMLQGAKASSNDEKMYDDD